MLIYRIHFDLSQLKLKNYENLLIIHDDYLDIILNVVGILLLVVGMAIYRHYVHQDSDQ